MSQNHLVGNVATNVPPIPETGVYPISDSDEARLLLQQLGSTVGRGLVELSTEISEPGVEQMLAALYPGCPLTRERDYSSSNRTWRYETIPYEVGRNFAGLMDEPLEIAEIAFDANLGTMSWMDFFGYAAVSRGPNGSGTPRRDTKDIEKLLRTPPDKLLARFGAYLDTRLQKVEPSSRQRWHTIRARQAMLPLGLMQLAYTAFPGGSGLEKDVMFSEQLMPSLLGTNDAVLEQIFGSSSSGRIYRSAIGMHRRLYAAGDDESFVTSLLEQNLITDIGDRLENSTGLITTLEALIANVTESTGRLGQELKFPWKTIESSIENCLIRMKNYLFSPANSSASRGKDWAEIVRKYIDSDSKGRAAFLALMQCQVGSHTVINGLVNRQFTTHTLDQLIARANTKPLKAQNQRVLEIKELLRDFRIEELNLDFVVAPPQAGLHTGRVNGVTATGGRRTGERSSPKSQEERIDALKYLIYLWGRGTLAYSDLPELGEDNQYVIALLPEELPNGEVIWHAVADNIEVHKHSILVFRAESGLNKYDHPTRTWDRVFRRHKSEMRPVGVRFFHHVGDLPEVYDRVIDYLLVTPDKIKRYEHYGAAALRGVLVDN